MTQGCVVQRVNLMGGAYGWGKWEGLMSESNGRGLWVGQMGGANE